ncbi:MAG: hypothetical protein KAY37_00690 [Phycisphaerae bacterium]|nr:hypothetical protein [Phycisphaerae bacterium]
MSYKTTQRPPGEKIVRSADALIVPDNPIIPFIRGDGSGSDIWRAAQPVFAAAVNNAYDGRRTCLSKAWQAPSRPTVTVS